MYFKKRADYSRCSRVCYRFRESWRENQILLSSSHNQMSQSALVQMQRNHFVELEHMFLLITLCCISRSHLGKISHLRCLVYPTFGSVLTSETCSYLPLIENHTSSRQLRTINVALYVARISILGSSDSNNGVAYFTIYEHRNNIRDKLSLAWPVYWPHFVYSNSIRCDKEQGKHRNRTMTLKYHNTHVFYRRSDLYLTGRIYN